MKKSLRKLHQIVLNFQGFCAKCPRKGPNNSQLSLGNLDSYDLAHGPAQLIASKLFAVALVDSSGRLIDVLAVDQSLPDAIALAKARQQQQPDPQQETLFPVVIQTALVQQVEKA